MWEDSCADTHKMRANGINTEGSNQTQQAYRAVGFTHVTPTTGDINPRVRLERNFLGEVTEMLCILIRVWFTQGYAFVKTHGNALNTCVFCSV